MFNVLHPEHARDHPHLFTQVGDALLGYEHYKHALNYYMMLEVHDGDKSARNIS